MLGEKKIQDFCGQNWKFLSFIIFLGRIKFQNCPKCFQASWKKFLSNLWKHQDFSSSQYLWAEMNFFFSLCNLPEIPKLLIVFFWSILESISHEFSRVPNFFPSSAQFFLGSLKNPSMSLVQSKVKLTPSNYFIYPFVWTTQGLVNYYLIFWSF